MKKMRLVNLFMPSTSSVPQTCNDLDVVRMTVKGTPAYLLAGPSLAGLGSIALSNHIEDAELFGVVGQPFLQVFLRNLIDVGPPGFPDSRAKYAIGFLAFLPIQNTGLGRPRDPSAESRLDINVLNAVSGSIMLDGEGSIGSFDGLAGDPTDTLKGEDFINVVTQGLVLPRRVL